MTKHTRVAPRLIAFLIAFCLGVGIQPAFAQESPTPEPAAAGSSEEPTPEVTDSIDNLALAINTTDDSSLVKFAFDVRRVMNGVVDQTNAAVAVASCENCRTVAVAIQIVIITGEADVITPENAAIALNYQCTSCETLASAYQFVFTTNGKVKFTKKAWREMWEIKQGVEDLLAQVEAGEIDLPTLQAELDVLMDRLGVVIEDAVERGKKDRHERGDEEEDAVEESPTPVPTMSAETSASPEPEPTDAEPSPTPSS
jgi:putative peptide zinc metalloprotease protein